MRLSKCHDAPPADLLSSAARNTGMCASGCNAWENSVINEGFSGHDHEMGSALNNKVFVRYAIKFSYRSDGIAQNLTGRLSFLSHEGCVS
jgi:hypothetical protein